MFGIYVFIDYLIEQLFDQQIILILYTYYRDFWITVSNPCLNG